MGLATAEGGGQRRARRLGGWLRRCVPSEPPQCQSDGPADMAAASLLPIALSRPSASERPLHSAVACERRGWRVTPSVAGGRTTAAGRVAFSDCDSPPSDRRRLASAIGGECRRWSGGVHYARAMCVDACCGCRRVGRLRRPRLCDRRQRGRHKWADPTAVTVTAVTATLHCGHGVCIAVSSSVCPCCAVSVSAR